MDEVPKVKVVLQGPDGDIETLWADPLGGDLTDQSRALLAGLRERGCGAERANVVAAVNVPPGVELLAVAQLLAESPFEWEYADPTYEELRAAGTFGHLGDDA